MSPLLPVIGDLMLPFCCRTQLGTRMQEPGATTWFQVCILLGTTVPARAKASGQLHDTQMLVGRHLAPWTYQHSSEQLSAASLRVQIRNVLGAAFRRGLLPLQELLHTLAQTAEDPDPRRETTSRLIADYYWLHGRKGAKIVPFLLLPFTHT